MTPWIVPGDRVKLLSSGPRGPLGTVVGLASGGVLVRWDGQRRAVKVREVGRLDVLPSARRERTGRVRGELDEDCLVRPESIGWYDEPPREESELERFMREMFPTE